MATVNALSVALFNAAAGGYSTDMIKNPGAYVGAVGAVLEKDLSTDAAYITHVLGNFGISSTSALFAEATAAMTGLVAGQGRALATTAAIDFLAGVPRTDKYAAVADAFFAKVTAATTFSTANAKELDVSKLIAAVTGTDTDVVATNTAFAAGAASRDSEVAALRVDVSKLQADLKASQDAAAAAKTAADAAATKAAADLKAANDKIALIDDTTFASESAAAAAAKTAAEAAAAEAAAAAKTAADAAATKAAADLAAANATITALQNPAGGTFALTSSTDVLVGTGGADTFTGSAANYADADIVVDASTTDRDTYNLSLTAAATPFAVNVEQINISAASTGTAAINASNMRGVQNLTVTRDNVVVGGSTITGNKIVDVTNLNASQVARVTAGAGTLDVNVGQATKAGVIVDAGTATGAIAVTGAATVNANLATGTVAITRLNNTTEDAKPVVVNAALSSSVTTADASFTGSVTFNAANASTITILNAVGGVVINGGTTSTADTTIRVDNIDNSGAVITTGTGFDDTVVTTLKDITINLDGTDASTDAASISAAGFITVNQDNADLVENLTLSGNGAAVTYDMTGTLLSAYALTGNQSVTVIGDGAIFTGKAVTDSTTAGTTTLKLDTLGADADLALVTTDAIEVAATGTARVLTVSSGANINLAADQTTSFAVAGKLADATVNLATADDTAANGTTIELTVGELIASTNVKTLNVNATVGRLTATATTLDTDGTDATTLNISGNKAVSLGTTNAKTINAAGLTAALTVDARDGVVANSITSASITSGSGNDSITLNDAGSDATVFTVDAGNGNNTVTITAAKEGTSVATGSGTDTINVNAAAAYVVVAGAGNDTVSVASTVSTDSILIGGDGTDTLTFAQTGAAIDLSAKVNFAFSGFEVVNISALAAANQTITISDNQFANQTFTLRGNSADDILIVTAVPSTTAATIDASNVTVDTATLNLVGSTRADVITGSAGNDLITATAGVDVIDGGAGTDTYAAATASQGVVVNLSSSAITATSVFNGVGLFTADTVTSVAAGRTAQLFTAAGSANLADQQTLSNIENVRGTAGKDYIIGSAAVNVITGGAGADYLTGGLGDDDFVFSAAATNGADVISDFTNAADDLNIVALITGSITADMDGAGADDGDLDVASILTTAQASVVDNGVIRLTNEGGTLAADDIAVAAANGKLVLADNGEAVVLVAAATTSTSFNVYYVADTDATAAQTYAVTLVGTVTMTANTFAEIAIGDLIIV